MAIQVIMPQFGESVIEGVLTRWLKQVGEQVEQHEALVEINTDKVDTELPSPATGVVLEILIPEGITVQAGTILAMIGGPEEATTVVNGALLESQPQPNAITHQVKPLSPEVKNTSKPRMGRDEVLGFISPLVARLAAEHEIDLHTVQGSGQGGRITKDDIQKIVMERASMPHTPSEQLHASLDIPSPSQNRLPGDTVQPLSAMRKQIADHLSRSKHDIPHVTTFMEADMSQVTAHRQNQKAIYAQSGAHLTYSAYFIKAAVVALRAYPVVNSSWHRDGILLHQQVNVGLAVALEDGLIVPVLKKADELSLIGIALAINDLAERARNRKLKPEEVQQGTFTITNHGINGSLLATPVINRPQCAILGVGAIQKRPVVVEVNGADALAIRPMAYLSLTFDHRILDGATADYFLAQVVSTLETWDMEG